MLVTVNAKKLHESASGVLFSGKNWKEIATNVLLGYSHDGVHPNSKQISKGKCSRCWSCRIFKKKDIRTLWLCKICGPICKNCEKDIDEDQKSLHLKYYELPTSSRSIHRSYPMVA